MVSAVILTKNEEKNIKACLESLSWCDERIVIDDLSEDNTRELAEKSGAKVYKHKLENFSSQRNFGLEKANGEWVLFIDADERISSPLWFEIMQHINDPIKNLSGFYFRRIDVLWDKKLKFGETRTLKIIRLAKKNTGIWVGDVHEKWRVSGKILTLNNPLQHYPHQSVAEFLKEINYYTDIRAKELYKENQKSNWISIILYPKAKFFLNYFLRLGILDGIPGLVFALMMSFHSFLVRGKLWLLWQKAK